MLLTLQAPVPLPGPASNLLFQVADLSAQKKPDLALNPSLGFLYPGSMASGELDSPRETDQNMLSPNVQQSETKPLPATASLPVLLVSSTYVAWCISLMHFLTG